MRTKNILFYRLLSFLSALLILMAASCPAFASHSNWVLDKLPGADSIYPVYDGKYESLTVRAIVDFHKRNRDTGNLYVVIPDIKKVEENAGQTRIFAYVSLGSFTLDKDGTYRWGMKLTSPYEIYAYEDGKTGTVQTYCGTPIPPRKLDPGVWESLEISESTYDPSRFLKEDLTNRAPAETTKRALAFLDSNKQFTLSVWPKIVGKPLEQAAPGEISSAMAAQQEKTALLYEEAVRQYNLLGRGKLSQEPYYAP